MRTRIAAIAIIGLGGCSSATPETLPTLSVTSPERGTSSEGGTVTVTGTATDDGAVTVAVNGVSVTPASDGKFSATITVGAGIGIIETIATDASGNAVRDVRAVLSGEVATSDGTVKAPIGATAGVEAMREIGTAMGDSAEALDYTALVTAMNPVYNNDGCLGAKVNVTSVSVGNIEVSLVPRDGVLDTDIAISNVVVRANADYKFSCFGGSTSITVNVDRARMSGNLGVGLSAGKIATNLPDVAIALDGFDINVGGVPGAVEDLLNDKVRDAVANSLENVIEDRVPGIANKALAGLLGKPYSTTILGRDTTVNVEPTELVLDANGLYVAIDTTLVVAGGEGGMFVSTPRGVTPSVMAGTRGLGIALADDAINQLFAGLWASQALEKTLPIEDTGPLAAILDDDAKTVTVHLMLPPQMTTQGDALKLSIGDLIVTTRDANGQEVQSLAVSLHAPITAGPSQSGKLLLTLGTPEIKAQVLAQATNVDRPLTDEQVEGIISSVWGVIGDAAGDALAKLPMPTVGGVMLGAPKVGANEGFVVVDVSLE